MHETPATGMLPIRETSCSALTSCKIHWHLYFSKSGFTAGAHTFQKLGVG